ncbi:hypothetical protein SAMN05421847_2771 [Halpernia humi]|uniref:Uncharacterized protein n=1 Tax=Halpernia humi TaxID=493375 RepID=A0A1H6B7I8_9FLAO|nr:hypothetical protein SAMN05421847_2771 [Halpernia humi]
MFPEWRADLLRITDGENEFKTCRLGVYSTSFELL